ncbi:S1 family peptidase [Plantactinospora siamensis]|uniref:S1 family peptidase n=1 Tax=Plantactinospora siamensis TaxID=555372 RepID=A0ABV6NSP7_9ACTN
MDRRRVILSGVTAAGLLALGVVTLPALADEHPGGRPAAPAASEAPELVAALSHDLAISPDQARARLRRERVATATTGALKAAVGASAWGGAWLSRDGARLTVAVTDPAQVDRVRAAGADPVVVARTAGDLDRAKQRLDRALDDSTGSSPTAAGSGATGWYVDVSGNTVTMLVRPGGERAAQRLVTRSGVDPSAVRMVTSAESPRPLFAVHGGDPYFIDGRARCSIGFAVTGGFVTAGHCGQRGSTTTGFNQVSQGVFTASSFPGDDWGVVRVNGDWQPQGVVNDFNGGTVPVNGSTEAPVGASICRSGSTTGVRCGVIQAKNATVNYPEGTVTGLTRTNVCAEAGDSGGSWISGDQAQGVTSGGSGDCTRGGVTFFQPITEILQANGLTLVTAASANGAGSANPDDAAGDGPGAPAAPSSRVRHQVPRR